MQQLFQDLCCPFFFAGFDKCQLHDSLQLSNPTGGGLHRLRNSHQKNTRSFQWVKIYRVLNVSILLPTLFAKKWKISLTSSISFEDTTTKRSFHGKVHGKSSQMHFIVKLYTGPLHSLHTLPRVLCRGYFEAGQMDASISKVTTNWRPNYFPTQFSIALVKCWLHSSVHCSTRPRALIVRYFCQMQSNEHAMMQSNTDLEHRFVYVS